MKKTTRKTLQIILFSALILPLRIFAQAGHNDPTFNSTGTGANSDIRATAIQSDGKIVIGGFFTTYNNTKKNYIARLNEDGTIDPSFNSTGTNDYGYVYSIVIQVNGKILIGGNFNSYNGSTRNGIARLNTDGTLDASFNPSTNTSDMVNSIAIQNDGKIVMCGSFNNGIGPPRNGITRLNADGTLDTGFILSSGANSSINSFAIQKDGKIITCGYFTNYNGIARNGIARLNINGSIDTSFTIIGTIDDHFYSIAIQNTGKILLSGFYYKNKRGIDGIIRLNTDGTSDPSFYSGIGANSTVGEIAIHGDGKIFIGGSFTIYNNAYRKSLARLNEDGAMDYDFDSYIGADSEVSSISFQSDGKIIIGGSFTNYSGTVRNRIARVLGSSEITSLSNSSFEGTSSEGLVIVSSVENGININTLGKVATIQIVDLTGNTVYTATSNGELLTISLHGNRLYMVVTESASEIKRQKVLVH